MHRYWSLWVLIGPCLSLWFLTGSYGVLCVFMRPHRSLCVPIGPYTLYGFLLVFMRPYKFFCVPVDANVFICVLMGTFASL